MIDRATFAEGLSRLAIATQAQDVNEATLNVYFDALGQRTSAEEWRRFSLAVVASGRFRFLPTVAEILDALREGRGERPLEVEAIETYERVIASGQYTPAGGTFWEFRRVRETCGEAAAQSFLAAGGNAAFRTDWDEPKRRSEFVRVYVKTVRSDPATRLLATSRRPALAVGAEPEAPGRAEAGSLLRLIHEKAGKVGERRPRRSSPEQPWQA